MRRKAASPSRSEASGNGVGSTRAEGKDLPNTVRVSNSCRRRERSPVPWPAPPGSVPAPVRLVWPGRAGPAAAPTHSGTGALPGPDLPPSRPSVAIRRAENALE